MDILPGVLAVRKARLFFGDPSLQERHRRSDKAFTRERKLRFDVVRVGVLRKTVKSLQLQLHAFFEALTGSAREAVTPSAWTQGRAKLRHTAFIELNQVAVVATFYGLTGQVELWRGPRLWAIDSSLLRLPHSAALFDFFGGQQPVHYSGPKPMRIPQARLSVLDDLGNDMGIEARVGKWEEGELDLACGHLPSLRPGDLLLCDRGDAGCLFLARVLDGGGQFLVRCSRTSFAAAQNLFARDEAGASLTTTLLAPTRGQQVQASGLPLQLPVRFVSVRLPSGELEVLVTSLLDEKLYPFQEFLSLYHQRWGSETYYKILKSRLDLENFTGLTVEAILQDIHASVFLSNLESLVTRPAAVQLKATEKEGSHPRKPNKAVTFHTLKHRVFDLLCGSDPIEEVLTQLTELFLANPVTIRSHRTPPRFPPTPLRSLPFQKRLRKATF